MVTQSETGQSSFFPSAQSATEEQQRWGVNNLEQVIQNDK